MAVRRVLSLFEAEDIPILRKRCRPVDDFGRETQTLVDDLLDTFESCQAYGIAAPQIGVSRRVVVLRLMDAERPLVLINPRITHAKGELKDYDGCLSIPGIYADTPRAERIHVEAYDRDGERFGLDAEEFDARIIQHEVDHLDGVLFIDRVQGLEELYRLVTEAETDEAVRAQLTDQLLEIVKTQRRTLPPPALRWR